jgi:hypothetical protein
MQSSSDINPEPDGHRNKGFAFSGRQSYIASAKKFHTKDMASSTHKQSD